ncbi:hypothetical protein COOONC_19163 [Cooperia oncophora]
MLQQMRNGTDVEDNQGEGRGVPASLRFKEPPQSSFKNSKNRQQILQQVSIWVNRVLDMGAPNLVHEFRDLRRWMPEGMTAKAFSENRPLNRYVDVPCQDFRRVILKWPGIDNDYIKLCEHTITSAKIMQFHCTQVSA